MKLSMSDGYLISAILNTFIVVIYVVTDNAHFILVLNFLVGLWSAYDWAESIGIMNFYTALKIIGGLYMILIGAWTVPAMSKTMGLNSPVNLGIAMCGLGLMIFLSYLESKGEI